MTKQELIEKLSKCDDPYEHETAEELLLQYINDQDIAEVWDEVSKEWWYS